MSKGVVWWRLALGAVVVLPLLAGAGPASAVSAKKRPPNCDITHGCEFQVTAFRAEMTASWSWSVSNQANNSGWASEEGTATFTETMKPHPLAHNGQRGDGVLIVRGKATRGIVAAPRLDTYDTHRVDKTAQHPPETCTNHGREGIGGSSLEFELAGPASGTVAIHWELGMQETGESESCMSETLASLLGIDRAKKLFTTTVHVGELKVPVVRLHGQGTAQVSLRGSDSAPGSTGFKSGGSVSWEATITLKRLPDSGFGS